MVVTTYTYVLVHASPHVFDMNVDRLIVPLLYVIDQGDFPLAIQMSNVECQFQSQVLHPLQQPAELGHRVDEHSRFRFKPNINSMRFRRL